MNPIMDMVSGLFKPAADAYGKHLDVKSAKSTAKAKLLQAGVDNEFQLKLSELELMHISKQMEGGTWKDEVAMVTGLSPLYLIMTGAILSAFGEPEFATGVNEGLRQLEEMGVPLGQLILISLSAGLGVRFLKR